MTRRHKVFGIKYILNVGFVYPEEHASLGYVVRLEVDTYKHTYILTIFNPTH